VSSFPHRLAAFTATLTVAIVAAAGWLALREGTPAAVPLLVLGVFATSFLSRDVPMANRFYVSAVPMVARTRGATTSTAKVMRRTRTSRMPRGRSRLGWSR